MENKFIWNPVYKKLPEDERTVIVQCDILDEPTLAYFDVDTREWIILDSQLVNENGADLNVIAWMEQPPRYIEKNPLEFRTAAQIRYLTSVNSKRKGDEEATNFFKIRRAINSASERGLYFCRIFKEDLTEDLLEKLNKSGYEIKPDGENLTINW